MKLEEFEKLAGNINYESNGDELSQLLKTNDNHYIRSELKAKNSNGNFADAIRVFPDEVRVVL